MHLEGSAFGVHFYINGKLYTEKLKYWSFFGKYDKINLLYNFGGTDMFKILIAEDDIELCRLFSPVLSKKRLLR